MNTIKALVLFIAISFSFAVTAGENTHKNVESVRLVAWQTYESTKIAAWQAYESSKTSAWQAYESSKTSAWQAYESTMAHTWKQYDDFDQEELKKLSATKMSEYYNWFDAVKIRDTARQLKQEATVPALNEYVTRTGEKTQKCEEINKKEPQKVNHACSKAWEKFKQTTAKA